MAQKPAVRILNPAPGGNTHTSHQRAARFVEAGLATREGRHIRMIHTTQPAPSWHDFTADNYDRINRCMSLDEIAGLPCAMPERALWGKDMRQP